MATRLGRIGSVICWEYDMPLLRTAMYAKGVELYCALTVDDRDQLIERVRTAIRALLDEGSIWELRTPQSQVPSPNLS